MSYYRFIMKTEHRIVGYIKKGVFINPMTSSTIVISISRNGL